jgi:hypothetical protein
MLELSSLAPSNHARDAGCLRVEPDGFRSNFDLEPFGFSHGLSSLSAFKFAELQSLAERYAKYPGEFFVSAGAKSAATDFNAVPSGGCTPAEAMARMGTDSVRLLLKRPERLDSRFRELLEDLFAEIIALRGGLRGERLVRLESGIFITSAAAVTPFHFDPEIAFFSQIEGEKIYHVYSPSVLSESELENFYLNGMVSIGQVELAKCDATREHIFHLRAGMGLHQPQNAPHWVETLATRSISYSLVFETDASRARCRARAFNHYARKLGIAPQAVGSHPSRDAIKAKTMRIVIPLRNRIRAKLRAVGLAPRAA